MRETAVLFTVNDCGRLLFEGMITSGVWVDGEGIHGMTDLLMYTLRQYMIVCKYMVPTYPLSKILPGPPQHIHVFLEEISE